MKIPTTALFIITQRVKYSPPFIRRISSERGDIILRKDVYDKENK